MHNFIIKRTTLFGSEIELEKDKIPVTWVAIIWGQILEYIFLYRVLYVLSDIILVLWLDALQQICLKNMLSLVCYDFYFKHD